MSIKTDNGLGVNNPSFKSLVLTAYTFTDNRMGVPELKAQLKWPTCLDDEWTGKEYVVLHGEKYYIRDTPSSKKDNTDARYSHELEFTSERNILSDIYFIDTVPSDLTPENVATADKPASNSTEFTLYGDINEFADRLNCAFRAAGIGDSILENKTHILPTDTPNGDGYVAVVATDGGYDYTKTAEVQLSDRTIFEALSDEYSIFEIPFAFYGKRIIFGEKAQTLSQTFGYGYDDELLSIAKNNAKAKVINRITGTGGSTNIPYYYPNETEYGHIALTYAAGNTVMTQNKIVIDNPRVLVSAVRSGSPIKVAYRKPGTAASSTVRLLYAFGQGPTYDFKVGRYKNTIFIPATAEVQKDIADSLADRYYEITYRSEFTVSQTGRFFMNVYGDLMLNVQSSSSGNIRDGGSSADNPNTLNRALDKGVRSGPDDIPTEYCVILKRTDVSSQDDYSAQVKITDDGKCELGILPNGKYSIVYHLQRKSRDRNGALLNIYARVDRIEVLSDTPEKYYIETNGKSYDYFESVGLKLVEGDISSALGESVSWESLSRMPFQTNLMPPIYRETLGDERFYNALNDTYPLGENTYRHFNNPFVENHPVEHIHKDESICPTIKGVTNSAGQLFGKFVAVGFDDNDSDSTTTAGGDGDSQDAKYVHPYFYVRLPKFDGPFGFDLFKQIAQEDSMTIQVTSGSCNGCKFKVQAVVKKNEYGIEYYENPVQTDPDFPDELLSGESDSKIKKDNPQTWQQNTMTDSIWIALQKEDSTFGVLMPNATNKYRPKAEDTFNITGISLPQSYILSAEERLKDVILDFMSENNDEKFMFNISISRIFLAENPDMYSLLNGNSRIKLSYNGKIYEQYVSSVTYKCESGEALPDVSVNLTDTLAATQGFVNKVVAQAASMVSDNRTGSTSLPSGAPIDNDDYLKRNENEHTSGSLTTDKCFKVGEFVPGSSGAFLGQDESGGDTYLEVDRLKVRGAAIIDSVVVSETTSIAGREIITVGGSVKVAMVETLFDADNAVTGYRCYYKTDPDGNGAEYKSKIIAGDMVYCSDHAETGGQGDTPYKHFLWSRVTSVGDNYLDLSATDCADNSDKPMAGDVLCQLGSSHVERQCAIIISVAEYYYATLTAQYVGIDTYELPEEKAMVGYGVNAAGSEAQMWVYGNLFVGDWDVVGGFMEYNREDQTLYLYGTLDIECPVGDTTLGGLINTIGDYSYLKEALQQSTIIAGGLIMTTAIILGYTENGLFNITAGMNGLRGSGDLSIASWWGGAMIDHERFPTTPNAAKALVRMNGTGYLSGGNISWNADGSGSVSGGKIAWDGEGNLTLASGVKLGGTDNETLQSILNFVNTINSCLVPIDANGNVLPIGTPASNIYALKANVGIISDKFMAAKTSLNT